MQYVCIKVNLYFLNKLELMTNSDIHWKAEFKRSDDRQTKNGHTDIKTKDRQTNGQTER